MRSAGLCLLLACGGAGSNEPFFIGAIRMVNESSKPKQFDFDTASDALKEAGKGAADCKNRQGPRGQGLAHVFFAPSGEVVRVEIEPPFGTTPAGACVADAFFRARIAPFESDRDVLLNTEFTVPK